MGKTARKKLKEARAAGTVKTHRVHDTGQVVSGMLSVSSHSASADRKSTRLNSSHAL